MEVHSESARSSAKLIYSTLFISVAFSFGLILIVSCYVNFTTYVSCLNDFCSDCIREGHRVKSRQIEGRRFSLLGHKPVARYSVSELCTNDTHVAIVFTLAPSFFSPAFFCLRNPKHTNLDSSWRNLDDLRT